MQKTYHSFLLRIWWVQVDEIPVWRASLENPFTGERKGFASLSELVVYLQAQVSGATDDRDEPLE